MRTSDAVKDLTTLNIEIGTAESKGDKKAKAWLDQVIAPKLAFRRANATFDDRAEFLDKVKPSDCRDTAVESVDLYGDQAFVRCVVTVKSHDGEKRYRNLRLFVRHDGGWKLLGWANEEL